MKEKELINIQSDIITYERAEKEAERESHKECIAREQKSRTTERVCWLTALILMILLHFITLWISPEAINVNQNVSDNESSQNIEVNN